MRKFTSPFDSYELTLDRPIAVELHPQGIVRYKPLYENPIYYFYAFQFRGGDFYRAVLGYETIWDEEFEDKLVSDLDNHLSKLRDLKLYYFEDIEILGDRTLIGLVWKRGVKPRVNFRMRGRMEVLSGTRALARINLADRPHHVDVQFEDGQIITMILMDYLTSRKRWITHTKKESPYAKQQQSNKPKQDRTDASNGQCRETSKVKSTGSKESVTKMAGAVHRVWKRFGRLNKV